LRQLGKTQGTIAITPRYLEALVRLAEASAKGRLSDAVELEDAERSVRLMRFCLKGIGMDPETGRFDIDIIATGQSKSRVDRARAIVRIIGKLNAQNGEATHEAILEEAKLQGVDTNLNETLALLKRNGDIYEPKHGYYKVSSGNE
jgi:replicative DNA helicase Mcm